MLFRVFLFLAAVSGLANVSISQAGCVAPAVALPGSALDAVRDNPSSLLPVFERGTAALTTEVRNLVTSDPAIITTILSAASKANDEQKRAIGAGLGQAALICAHSDPETVRLIQEALLKAADQEMTVAFQALTGDTETAAVDSGGGGVANGGSGSGTIPRTTPTVPARNVRLSSESSISEAVANGIIPGSSTTSTFFFSTASNSVSP